MISIRLASALAAASVFSMASAATGTSSPSSSTVVSIATPTASVALNAMTAIGCFNISTPLEDHGSYLYQTAGNCQPICVLLGKAVMGLVDGSNCYCGDLIPPKENQIANSSCNTPCNGDNEDDCGGNNVWWVLQTGLNHNKIANYEPSSSSSSAAASSATQASEAASVVVVTASTSATAKAESKSSGPSKAGIAAGVVVGVVGLAAIIAGVVFYLRHRRRREVEEEYRRQAAVNQFVGGGKLHTSNSSMTDSRLDPEFMARRASNGSIADNEDYSRRILKVTNA